MIKPFKALTVTLLACAAFFPANSYSLSVVAVGDVMPGSAFPFSSELPPNDGQNLFNATQSLWGNADIVFGNLEAVLIDDVSLVRDCPPASTSCYRFGTPTRYIQHLKNAGFNVLNSANNHVHDFDTIGRKSTLATVDEAGLTGFGVIERPSTTQVLPNGIRIGWVGYAPHTGANPPSIEAIREQITQLKRNHDYVMMSMHVGAEGSAALRVTRETEMFLGKNRGNPYALAHAAIDAGADLVIGHGPHVLRGLELYKGRLIAYSLGNFSTYGRFNLKGPNGLAGVLQVTLNRDGEFIRGQFTGTRQEKNTEAWRQGVTPTLDNSNEAVNLLRTLSKEDFPESKLIIESDGRLIRPDLPPEPESKDKPLQQTRLQITPIKVSPAQPPSSWSHVRRSFNSFYVRSRNAIRNLASN